MDALIAGSARQVALDQIHAVAIRLRRDTVLVWAGDLAPRLLALHRCVCMTEDEVINELVREGLIEDERPSPLAGGP